MTATIHRESGPQGVIRSLIPARLDRLRWSRFHTRVVMALGVAWVLDGLEITIAGNAASLLSSPQSLHLSSAGVGFAVGTIYLLGEVAGALFFGRLVGPLGPAQPVHDHPGCVPHRRGHDGLDLRSRRRLGPVPLSVPLHRRHGHRR